MSDAADTDTRDRLAKEAAADHAMEPNMVATFRGSFEVGFRRGWDARSMSSADAVDEAALSDLANLKAVIAETQVMKMGEDDYRSYCLVVTAAQHLIAKLERTRSVVSPTVTALKGDVKPAATSPIDDIAKENEALKAENAELKAKLWVAKDSKLRTYDGIAEERDAYRAALEWMDALDHNPQNHHVDASKCCICKAQEVLAQYAESDRVQK